MQQNSTLSTRVVFLNYEKPETIHRSNSMVTISFVFACRDRLTRARKDQRYSLLTKKMTFQRNSFGSGEKRAVQFLSSIEFFFSLVDQVRLTLLVRWTVTLALP